ncbi:hypothetical protein [Sphingomonas sp. LY160]|uniref:hypothetical protein n=1 Tax=Sphingomonas sp. LY160 TaxID=3095342 RepID=UPI002ADEA66F|nr:hypothetical protein [Sphingomonas sp. LY160]MEA1072453.1 hypothetical protein [Sphingomonas sp. LY160]
MRSFDPISPLPIAALALVVSACATTPVRQDPAGLGGTAWSVENVNGVSTDGRTDFTVTFSGSTFDAQFGCRRATGRYAISYSSNGDLRPIFKGRDARISGKACTGKFAEEIGPEIISNSYLSVDRQGDGRLMLAEPPTGILLRPLTR